MNRDRCGQEGFVYIIVVIIVMGLSILGLSLAAGTASNMKAQQIYEKLEADYYSVDGAMTYIQAVLERAGAYARSAAQKAVDQVYNDAIAADEVPPTSDELDTIYKNTFLDYISKGNGNGYKYINKQLAAMKTHKDFLVEPEVDWLNVSSNVVGMDISVTVQRTGTGERLAADFKIPFNYIPAEEKEYSVGGDYHIGHYNPVLRSALTMNCNVIVNGDSIFRSNTPDGIAIQWTNRLSPNQPLIDIQNGISVYGRTLPIIQKTYPRTIKGTYQWIKSDGIEVNRTPQYEGVPQVSLNEYYDNSYMSQIVKNAKSVSWETQNNFFYAEEDGYVLCIYPGQSGYQPDWRRYHNKKGLVIFENRMRTTNENGSFIKFTGAIVVLGTEESHATQPMDLTYDPEAVEKAISLYRKTTGQDTLEKMFKLDTLMQNPTEPESYKIKQIKSSPVLNEPITISNQKVTASGITTSSSPAEIYISQQKLYLYSSKPGASGIQTPTGKFNYRAPQWDTVAGINVNDSLLVGGGGNKEVNVGKINNIYSYLDKNKFQDMVKNRIPHVVREEADEDSNYILLINAGDIRIFSNGRVDYADGQYHAGGEPTQYEPISGKRGLILVNGKLTIESNFDFTGVIIATDGINLPYNSRINITYDYNAALRAINLSKDAVEIFDTGDNTLISEFSIYGEPEGSGGGGGGGGSGSTKTGAANSGTTNLESKGILIKDWKSVRGN